MAANPPDTKQTLLTLAYLLQKEMQDNKGDKYYCNELRQHEKTLKCLISRESSISEFTQHLINLLEKEKSTMQHKTWIVSKNGYHTKDTKPSQQKNKAIETIEMIQKSLKDGTFFDLVKEEAKRKESQKEKAKQPEIQPFFSTRYFGLIGNDASKQKDTGRNSQIPDFLKNVIGRR